MSVGAVTIAGAGPAGLAAALAARGAGCDVVVHEKRRDAGARFHGDFQGLENWTGELDVLEELQTLGISPGFFHRPVREFVCFDHEGRPWPLRSDRPVFYLVKRGTSAGTLDQSLKEQALQAGVQLRFESRLQHVSNPGAIVAEGPHRADVIAAGFVFETDMADGCYVAVSNRLAPGGYGYLLVSGGCGTVATCLFDEFHQERLFLERTVDFFRAAAGLRWADAHRFGGSGNFDLVADATVGGRFYVGEAAGLQDALFGFGLRYAITSGVLAGRAWADPAAGYDASWRLRLGGLNAAGIANRRVFRLLGNRGRTWVLRHIAVGRDPRRLLRRIYAPARWKSSLARMAAKPRLFSPTQIHDDCDCTWCRCHRQSQRPESDSA